MYSNPNPPAVPVALGIDSYSSDEIGPGAARAVGAGDEPALLITHVYPGGPSARADLREGDVLLRVDGQATENRDRLQAILGRHRPQDSVEVEFLRGGSTLRATLVLEPTMDLLSRACEAGDASACFAAAIRLRAGIPGSLARDPARAAALYERACTAGRQDACINLGRLLRRGDDGVEGNPARSAVLFERACQEGVPAGCHNLGILYREGLGVARDPERARALTQQACEGGDADACGRGAEHSP